MKFILFFLLLTNLISCTNNHEEPNNQGKQNIKACTKEAKMCPNGEVVGRDSLNNCEFNPCTKKSKQNSKKLCTADVKQCANGKFVGRDANNNCQFPDCDVKNIL